MDLIKATNADFNKIADFYKYVIDNTPDLSLYCRWIYGLHPSDEMILEYINSGEMFFSEFNGEVAFAAAVTKRQEENYRNVKWSLPLNDDEVSVVHILCVNPTLSRQGIGKDMLHKIINYAKMNGKKTVRLDALASNLPAHKFYANIGFRHVDTRSWHAGNTGLTDFYLFEYNI